MKAIQCSRFGGAEVLEYVDLPRPSPEKNKLLIAVTAAGVKYSDIRERQGVYQRAETRVGGVVLPHVTGLQAAGRAADFGPQGDRSLIGRKVVALLPGGGGYSQSVTAPVSMTVILPDCGSNRLPAQIRATRRLSDP